MRSRIWKKGGVIGIILLFFGASVFPSVSGDSVTQKNARNVANSQKFDDLNILNIGYKDREYVIGRITNLTYEDGYFYYFDCINVRVYIFWINGPSWGIEYRHFFDNYGVFWVGYEFKGIVKPTFICGYFYS